MAGPAGDPSPPGWPDVDPRLQAHVDGVAAAIAEAAGDALVGVWLHGSLAAGSFRAGRSDVDLLVVLAGSGAPAGHIHGRTADVDVPDRVLRSAAAAGQVLPGRGGDVVVVGAEAAAGAPHPLPVLARSRSGVGDGATPARPPLAPGPDPVAVGALADARRWWVVLAGSPAGDALGPPAWADVADAAMTGFDRAVEHGMDVPALAPEAVLDACRGLGLLASPPGTLLHREEAGAWALARLPRDQRPVVEAALVARRAPDGMLDVPVEAVRRFRRFVIGATISRRRGRRVHGLP